MLVTCHYKFGVNADFKADEGKRHHWDYTWKITHFKNYTWKITPLRKTGLCLCNNYCTNIVRDLAVSIT